MPLMQLKYIIPTYGTIALICYAPVIKQQILYNISEIKRLRQEYKSEGLSMYNKSPPDVKNASVTDEICGTKERLKQAKMHLQNSQDNYEKYIISEYDRIMKHRK